jgi:hypothetical protein
MVAIDGTSRRGAKRGAYLRQLFRREAVGLEVGEAPVGIAEVRPASRRAAVRIDGFRGLPECLQGMADRQVHLGIGGGSGEQLPVEPDGALVLAKSHRGCRVQQPQREVPGVVLEKPVEFAAALLVAVQLDQHARVLLAGDAVMRGQREDCREQQLRIVEHLVGDADAGQQPHRLDVVAVLEQVAPDQWLCELQIAIGEQPCGHHDLLRKLAQRCDVASRHGGVFRLPGHAIQALEHGPAAWQRVVDVHGLEESSDGLGCLTHLHVAAAAFLVEAAEARMVVLDSVEGLHGIGDAVQVALCDGDAQQSVAMASDFRVQPLAGGQHRCELMLAHQCPDARHVRRSRTPHSGGCRGGSRRGGGGSRGVSHIREHLKKRGRTP